MVEFPEGVPEVLIVWMECRITWNHRSGIRPSLNAFDKTGAHRVLQQVRAMRGEAALETFFISQDVIVCLRLKVMWRQKRLAIGAKKRHAVSLVAFCAQAHPKKVDMIWH